MDARTQRARFIPVALTLKFACTGLHVENLRCVLLNEITQRLNKRTSLIITIFLVKNYDFLH